MDKKLKINNLKEMFYPEIEEDVILFAFEENGNHISWIADEDVEDTIEYLLQIQNYRIPEETTSKDLDEIDINSPQKNYNFGMNPHLKSPQYVVEEFCQSKILL